MDATDSHSEIPGIPIGQIEEEELFVYPMVEDDRGALVSYVIAESAGGEQRRYIDVHQDESEDEIISVDELASEEVIDVAGFEISADQLKEAKKRCEEMMAEIKEQNQHE